MRKNISGISLLELLLSLALIAIILIMATRFYESTRSSQQSNEAVDILQHLVVATDKWFELYKNFQNTDNGPISLQKIISLGWLPQSFSLDNANPWGGSINIEPEDDAHVKFTLGDVPAKDCLNLQELMQEQSNLKGTCDSENYTAIYSSSGVNSSPKKPLNFK